MSNKMQRACVIGAATLALIAVCLAGIYLRYGTVRPFSPDPAVSSDDPAEIRTTDELTAESPSGESPAAESTEEPTQVSEESLSETETERVTEEEPESESETEVTTTAVPTESKSEEPTGIQMAFVRKLGIDVEKAPSVFVREETNLESRTLTVLYPSDVVTYLKRVGNYYEVVMDGFNGFVHKDYVLTDMDLYEDRKDYIGYAVMAPVTDVMLYASMDDSQSPMIAAEKADEFRLAGIEDGWYRVNVRSSKYDFLYVKQEDVFVYPFFLNYGDVPELKDWELEYLNGLDLSKNIQRAKDIVIERKAELAAYSSYDAQVASEKAAEEAARKEAARKKAAEEAARIQAEAERARQEAEATGQMVLLGTDFTITKYCHCTKCCGKWGHDDPNYVAHGASGMNLIAGYSVAVDPNLIPYGSKILVDGKIYEAMDTSDHFPFGSHWLDIYCATHEETIPQGERHNVTVYLLPN